MPEEEGVSNTWSVSFPNLPEAAGPGRHIRPTASRPSEANSLASRTHLCRRRSSTGSQQDFALVPLPPPHPLHPTSPGTQALPLNDPDEPARSTVPWALPQGSVRNQAETSEQDISLQSFRSPRMVGTLPTLHTHQSENKPFPSQGPGASQTAEPSY